MKVECCVCGNEIDLIEKKPLKDIRGCYLCGITLCDDCAYQDGLVDICYSCFQGLEKINENKMRYTIKGITDGEM